MKSDASRSKNVPVKQVIVMRKDLNMRRGKEIAQGSHASMAFITRRLKPIGVEGVPDHQYRVVALTLTELAWLDNSFTKVCVRVDSEDELKAVHEAALDAGLVSHLVVDAGATEFHGVPTMTCCAIGPDEAEKIDPITGHLRLY